MSYSLCADEGFLCKTTTTIRAMARANRRKRHTNKIFSLALHFDRSGPLQKKKVDVNNQCL